jgi:hypothetical protein
MTKKEKVSYYYDLMTKEMQKEWIEEFKAAKRRTLPNLNDLEAFMSLNEFLGMEYNSFDHFIGSSFDWGNTKRGIKWWAAYARTDVSRLLSCKREDKLKELGI